MKRRREYDLEEEIYYAEHGGFQYAPVAVREEVARRNSFFKHERRGKNWNSQARNYGQPEKLPD